MSLIFWFAVFFMWWWILLLAVLPWGVRTQVDDNSTIAGTASSAPIRPNLKLKFIINTVIALVLTLAIRWAVENPNISVRPLLLHLGAPQTLSK